MNLELNNNYDSLFIIGPTAVGKTNLAVAVAYALNTTIISTDARQVYKNLNLGTGKDLESYNYKNTSIPYALIDIIEPNVKNNIHTYLNDAKTVLNYLKHENKIPLFCGGSGFYIESLIVPKPLIQIPNNAHITEQLNKLSFDALKLKLMAVKHLFKNQSVDFTTKKRVIRALEQADYLAKNTDFNFEVNALIRFPLIFGLDFKHLESRRNSILKRMNQRFVNGMLNEVETLMHQYGYAMMQWLGLEYKLISDYLVGKMDLKECEEQLYYAICQYARRQMTYFRKIEKMGFKIHWLKTEDGIEANTATILSMMQAG